MLYKPINKRPNLPGSFKWQHSAVAIMDVHISRTATQLITTFAPAMTGIERAPVLASRLINPTDTPTYSHNKTSELRHLSAKSRLLTASAIMHSEYRLLSSTNRAQSAQLCFLERISVQ